MPSLKQAILIILIVCSIGAAAWVVPSLDDARASLAIKTPAGANPSHPTIVLLTNVLGGFKGLLVDAVWLRAGDLQNEGKYWELYQLYDWIGKLEPRLQEIWVFNGWNMAYNLVAELPDSEARWQWISRAIEYMRDEGLKYNPLSGTIMERIGWIYFHKIGRDTDPHHFYYKHRLALELYPVVLGRDDQDVQGWADAPEDLNVLLQDPDVRKVLSDFQLNPPEPAVENLGKCSSLLDLTPQMVTALENTTSAEGRRKIRNYITARVLRTKYKMDRFDIMIDMEKKFGKFEWRLPDPHAIYWATLAMQAAPPSKVQKLNYDRMVMYSLQELMRRGQIAFMSVNPEDAMITTFDLTKIPAIQQLYEEQLNEHPLPTNGRYVAEEKPGADSIRDGHVQFLKEAARTLYFAGFKEEALKYHNLLYTLYDKPDPYMDIDHYVIEQVKGLVEEHGTTAKVREFVDGLIFQACYLVCVNKPDQARIHESLAKQSWNVYRDYEGWNRGMETTGPKKNPMPTFSQVMTEDVRTIVLGRAGFPQHLVPMLKKILNVPENLKPEEITINDVITPKIPESSPPPK